MVVRQPIRCCQHRELRAATDRRNNGTNSLHRLQRTSAQAPLCCQLIPGSVYLDHAFHRCNAYSGVSSECLRERKEFVLLFPSFLVLRTTSTSINKRISSTVNGIQHSISLTRLCGNRLSSIGHHLSPPIFRPINLRYLYSPDPSRPSDINFSRSNYSRIATMPGKMITNPASALAATVTVMDQHGKVVHNGVSSLVLFGCIVTL